MLGRGWGDVGEDGERLEERERGCDGLRKDEKIARERSGWIERDW